MRLTQCFMIKASNLVHCPSLLRDVILRNGGRSLHCGGIVALMHCGGRLSLHCDGIVALMHCGGRLSLHCDGRKQLSSIRVFSPTQHKVRACRNIGALTQRKHKIQSMWISYQKK